MLDSITQEARRTGITTGTTIGRHHHRDGDYDGCHGIGCDVDPVDDDDDY